jgi:hypothetical protein
MEPPPSGENCERRLKEIEMKVNELAGWDPNATGSSYGRGSDFTIPAEQVNVKMVVQIAKNRVEYIGTSQRKSLPYFLDAKDEKMAKKLAAILENNIGISLRDVGLVEIPED